MAKILFLVDFEEGHVLSTMSLSKTLAARGHSVLYAGLPDAEQTVAAKGFAFRPIMQDLFPVGTLSEPLMSASTRAHTVKGAVDTRQSAFECARGLCFARCVSGELVDCIIRDFRPDVAVALSYYYLEALALSLRHGLPIVFFTPDLRTVSRAEAASSIVDGLMNSSFGVWEFVELLRHASVPVRSLSEIPQLLLKMPELIALPRSFEEPQIEQDALVYYIGSGVDMQRCPESGSRWRDPARGRPLIYCALGSQCALELETSTRFFNIVIRAMADRPEWYMLMSVGKAIDIEMLSACPLNVSVVDWVPQMEVLSDASLMINHGGIGTVKQCILSRVAMVVFPLMRDQFDCAERVVRHGLGLSGSMDSATPELVTRLIKTALNDPNIRRNIDAMGQAFRDEDRISVGADIVEEWALREAA